MSTTVYCSRCDRHHSTDCLPMDCPYSAAWSEYDSAASDLARKGLTGAIGDPLPNLMSAEAVRLINADPEAFQKRVRQCAYEHAMEKASGKVFMRVKIEIPARLDTWLWEHCRTYRRRAIRAARVAQLFHCDICHTTDGVSVLRNGGQLCATCREVLSELPCDERRCI